MLEKLAAMIPKPLIHLLVYHGVFAPHAHGRKEAVRRAHDGVARTTACKGPILRPYSKTLFIRAIRWNYGAA